MRNLGYWLLDRSFVTIACLASTTCVRTDTGRFYGWEGVNCCSGTCNHVWHYAQAVGRVFPELERTTRENVDYGFAYLEDGRILYRGEFTDHEATDGQCGTILRVFREHTMSADDGFLRRIWPRVKGSIEFLIKEDGNANGVLEGAQFNTLDSAWYGPISWISSLYLAALRAGSVMAGEMGDPAFAQKCDQLILRGSEWVSEHLFDGEYYFQQRDPDRPEAFGAGIGCHIDQVMGQGWAHQLGLGRILPEDKTRSALQSLWRYNFTPDVGPYRKKFEGGRWYAMPGEAGLIMCTFPKGGEREARGGQPGHGFAGYLNECMNGFECHGPNKHIGFAPRITTEKFKSAFIAAEGWGSYSQRIENGGLAAEIAVQQGRLPLLSLALASEHGNRASATLDGDSIPLELSREGKRVYIRFAAEVQIPTGGTLRVKIS